MHGVRSGRGTEKQTTGSQIPVIRMCPVKIPSGAVRVGNYIIGKTIGSGSYGKVHLGLHIATGERVAVKVIEKSKLSEKDRENINRQIQIMKLVLHPSLILLYEIIETEKSLLFVTEYMPNGELFNYIIERQKLSEDESRCIFHQLMEGLHYLRNIGITHRDIKPENILIDYNGRVKLIDFGLSNFYQQDQKLRTECGSPCYAAPEMIEGKEKYDPVLIDVWSSGVVLFSMMAGYLPFCDPDISTLYKKILLGSYKFPSWFTHDAKDLLSRMLTVDPAKRIKLDQIFEHPWYHKKQVKKNTGINPKLYKVPFDVGIVQNLVNFGIDRKKLQESIEINIKNKETAMYYIIAKKLIKQKTKIISYFASQDFQLSLAKPWKTEFEKDSLESALAQVETISPIPLDIDLDSPISDSEDPLFFSKSLNIIDILRSILESSLQVENDNTTLLKEIFYCHNPQYNKKRYQLRIENQKIKRGKSLFTITKRKPYKYQKSRQKKDLNQQQNQGIARCVALEEKRKLLTPNVSQVKKVAFAQSKLTVTQVYAKSVKKQFWKKLTPMNKKRPNELKN